MKQKLYKVLVNGRSCHGGNAEWKKGKWAILFSHPADFTPVCTTEIGRLALKYDKLAEMGCLVATLSVDPVKSHEVRSTQYHTHGGSLSRARENREREREYFLVSAARKDAMVISIAIFHIRFLIIVSFYLVSYTLELASTILDTQIALLLHTPHHVHAHAAPHITILYFIHSNSP